MVAGILILMGILWAFGFEYWFNGNDGWAITGMFFAGIGLVAAIVWLFMLIPYDSKYHVLYKLEGKVESVSNTFVSGSGKMTSRPIIYLSGYEHPITMRDSRIVPLEGKEVELVCSIQWGWEAMDGTNCNVRAIK